MKDNKVRDFESILCRDNEDGVELYRKFMGRV
jgi:hypothetical protein